MVAVLSGGNIDPLLLLRIIRHGMAAAGRYLQFRVRVSDRPGSLAGLLADCAAVDANVLEVEHIRTGTTITVDEVEIGLQLETRGQEHCEDVLRTLRVQGLPAQVRLTRSVRGRVTDMRSEPEPAAEAASEADAGSGAAPAPATRLISLDDAPVLAAMLRDNRDFMAPFEPARAEANFTDSGQLASSATCSPGMSGARPFPTSSSTRTAAWWAASP